MTMQTYWLEPWRYADEGAVINWLEGSDGGSVEVNRNGSWSEYLADYETQMPDGTDPDGGSNVIHRVVLDDLDADTEYDFRFEDGGTERTLRTLPSTHTRDVVIAQGSDHQSPDNIDDSVFRSINGLIAEEDPDIVVMNGDIVRCSGGETAGEDEWVHFMELLQEDIWDAVDPVPFTVATIGNHDLNPNSLMRACDDSTTLDEPRDPDEEPCSPPIYLQNMFHVFWEDDVNDYHDGYGYLTAGDWLLLIGFDNGFWNLWEDQTTWLHGVRDDVGESYDHTVAIQHMDPFPSSRDFYSHEVYEDAIVESRDEWHRPLQEMGCNWCFVAHEHVFSMSPPIEVPEGWGEVEPTDDELITDNPRNGIRYIGGGSWNSNTGPRSANQSDKWWNEITREEHNYPVITLHDDDQVADAYEWDGDAIVEGESLNILTIIRDATLHDAHF